MLYNYIRILVICLVWLGFFADIIHFSLVLGSISYCLNNVLVLVDTYFTPTPLL